MKKITLFLLGLQVMTSASADENEYVPLVREGVVWEYVSYNHDMARTWLEDVYNFTLLNSMAQQLLTDYYIITSIAPTMTSREMPKNPILQPMSERRAKWLQPLKMMFMAEH